MKYAAWWLPVLLMALITPFTPALDVDISRFFFDEGHSQFFSNGFAHFLYDYGTLPGIVAIAVAAVGYLLSFCLKRWRLWREPALVFILTAALGAGVIVHGLLKEHWGRPRPKQVVEFGGGQEFRPYYSPNVDISPEPSKSFSCGHCTMGFVFFALALAGRRLERPSLTYLGFILAGVLGIGLSLARIAEGGHFLSDTLISALVMWLTALTANWLIEEPKRSAY